MGLLHHLQPLLHLRSRGDDSSSTDIASIQGGIDWKPRQDSLHLSQDLRESQTLISKLKEKIGVLQNENTDYQEKLEEISTDMNLLLRMIPSWEITKEIAESPILFLLAMAKRILTGTKEREMNIEACNMQTDSNIVALRNTQDELKLTCWPSFSKETPLLNYQDKENAFSGTSRLSSNIPKIIRQYLKTIQGLEKNLANKEQEVGEKNQALKEVQDDLARDEKIFAEKMREIKALKLLTRELTVEKDCLLQKVQLDATIISDLSHNALAKEDELSRLRASFDSLHMQPQEEDRNANEDYGHFEQCAMFNAPEEHQKLDHQDWDNDLPGETQKAQEEVDTSRELRPVRDKTTKKLPIVFEKRFQDLAYNILKGGQFIQTACTNETQAGDKVPKMSHEAEIEIDIQVPCKDMNVPPLSNIRKQDSVFPKAFCDFFSKNQDSFHKDGVATEDQYPGTGSTDSLQNEKDGQRNPKITKQDPEYVGTRDMDLEKKLREITLTWHAEKQAMEEMVQAERETWEARAMHAVKKQEQLERDHQALKEELENTKSLMQKAGLGIRLSAHNVRELTNGDVDLRTSITC
ncbi:hypothetical protein L7F22_053066 [Adiantum nelumboides]|nr:hypothetical protein [Adiantum nelumboides]